MVLLCVLVAQLCPTLCDPMDYSPPGSSIHGILQARILEWVALPSPRDRPNPGIEPRSPVSQADSSPSEPPGYQNYQWEQLVSPRYTWQRTAESLEDGVP